MGWKDTIKPVEEGKQSVEPKTGSWRDTITESSSKAKLDPDAPGIGEAITRGAGQGLTLGFADEAAAGIQAGLDVATSDKEMKDLVNLYNTYKQLQQEREGEVEKAYPKTYLASEIAGGLPTVMLPGGQANTAKSAMTLGGIMGLGKSKASLTGGNEQSTLQNVGQAAFDTGLGTAMGYGGYKIGEKLLGPAAQKSGIPNKIEDAAQSMRQEAEDLSLRGLDASRKALEKEKGKTWRADPEYRKGVGEEALEVMGEFWSPSAEKVRGRVIQQVDEIEGLKKPLMESLDQQLQSRLQTASSEELTRLGDNALGNQLSKLRNELVAEKNLLPGSEASIQNLAQIIDDYAARIAGRDNVVKGTSSLKSLDEVKKALNTAISDSNFAKVAQDAPEQAQIMLKIRDVINKRIDELADFAGTAEAKLIKDLNRKESNLYDLGNIAWRKETKPSSQGLFNVSDSIAAGLGGAVGSAIPIPGATYAGMAAGVGGKRLLERIAGNNVGEIATIGVAKGLKRASEFGDDIARTMVSAGPGAAITRSVAEKVTTPERMSKNLYDSSDEELADVVQKLNSNPKFGSYGMALNDAITGKSKDKKNAVLFTIMQNPEMRKILYPQE